MKPKKPKRWNAGRLPQRSDTRIAASSENTRKAKNSVPPWNRRSASRWPRACAATRPAGTGDAPRPSAGTGAAGAALDGTFISPADGSMRGPDRLAARFDLRLPGVLDQLDHAGRHRHVVELARHLAALVVRPVEELQHLLRDLGLRRVLVDHDEGGAGDGPRIGARLVGQQQVEARRLRPIGVGGRRLEALGARLDVLARLVLQHHVADLVLQSVGVLDVADGAVDASGVGGDALVALAAHPGRPGHGGVLAHLLLPLRAHLGEVVSEDEG